jgi:HYDIN/CFA65/VesB family protein
MRRCWGLWLVMLVVGSLASASAALADTTANPGGITNSGDDGRTGWYPNANISPEVVSGGTFGQLWSAPVKGQVYAQPLVDTTTSGGTTSETVIVATETNWVYGLDPNSKGTPRWGKQFPGTPWNPADVSCADIAPSIGTTATPVIDPTTNTVYVTHKVYDTAPGAPAGAAAWYLDALDATSGAERPNFPVKITGNADNDPSVPFDPKHEQQRPGLLLLNGVVYMGFGGHCDAAPWEGWVIGVSTSTAQITARWVDNPTLDGAGIWQSGVGLTSDGPNTLLVTTGNGGSPTTPTAGSQPPDTFGESVVRLNVQRDGSLKPVDFFAPFDTVNLDTYDADFGSGALVALPDKYFGTSTYPHLGVVVGKEGFVYLLNRDNLGGLDQGPTGDDNVLQRLGRFGGVWGRPGVWPGDGGYVYVPTSTGQTNGGTFDVYKYGQTGTGASAMPALSRVATSSDTFGWGSGSPIITSNGVNSGTALVWVVWSADRTGAGAQLRAYNPIPAGGKLGAPVYEAPIGTSTNYNMPGVGNDGRLYIGTRDGHLLAFGSPVTQPVTGAPVNFSTTTMGSSSAPSTLTLTANEPVKVSSVVSTSSQFTVGTPTQALPALLATGSQISVPITFSPTQTGLVGGELTITTDSGPVSIPVSGTGQAATPHLEPSTSLVSLGGTTVGGSLSDTFTLTDDGNAPVQISSVTLPNAPFTATGLPSVGDTIDPGQMVTVEIDFNPNQAGQFSDEIDVSTADGEKLKVGIGASATLPGVLGISPATVDFGPVATMTTATKSFTLTNSGGTPVTINKSKPPLGGDFTATTALNEGTTIPPGQSVTETVTFTPQATGPASAGTWAITGDDGSGLHDIQFIGTGVNPGVLQVSEPSIDFGSVKIGDTPAETFTVTNVGATNVTITDSTPPIGGAFSAVSQLTKGTVIAPGGSVSETVMFAPTSAGAATPDSWSITGDDASGPHVVRFRGSGIATAATTTTTTTPPPTGSRPQRPAVPQAPRLAPGVTTTAGLAHTYLTYTALVAKSATFTVERELTGGRSHGRCVALTGHHSHAARCTRWVTVATFTHHDSVGSIRLALTSLAPARKLTPGTYRIESVLLDVTGKRHAFTATLRVTAAKVTRVLGAMLAEIAGRQQGAVTAEALGAVVQHQLTV